MEHFTLEQPKKPFLSNLRIGLIKAGIIKPKTLKETRECFPFPVEKQEQPRLKLWGTQIEKRYPHGGVKGTL